MAVIASDLPCSGLWLMMANAAGETPLGVACAKVSSHSVSFFSPFFSYISLHSAHGRSSLFFLNQQKRLTGPNAGISLFPLATPTLSLSRLFVDYLLFHFFKSQISHDVYYSTSGEVSVLHLLAKHPWLTHPNEYKEVLMAVVGAKYKDRDSLIWSIARGNYDAV